MPANAGIVAAVIYNCRKVKNSKLKRNEKMKNAMTDAPKKGAKMYEIDYREQTRITLEKVQYFAPQSHETHCFSAALYFDGIKIGDVGNAGHGGCDDVTIINQAGYDDMQGYIAGFASVTSSVGGDHTYTYQPDLEGVCCELVNQWLFATDLKKLLRKRVLVSRDGRITQTQSVSAAQRDHWAAQAAEQGETVLNLMPFTDALALYRAEVG
jgi:hypothetical protein